MSSKTLSDLTQATSINATDLTHIRQSLVDKKATINAITKHVIREGSYGFHSETITEDTEISAITYQQIMYLLDTSSAAITLTLPFAGGGVAAGAQIIVEDIGSSNSATVTYQASISKTIPAGGFAIFRFNGSKWEFDSSTFHEMLTDYLQIGSSGPRIKKSDMNFAFKTNDETGFTGLIAKYFELSGSNQILEVESDSQTQLKNLAAGIVLGAKNDTVFCGNCYWDGTSFNRIDTTKKAIRITTDYDNGQLTLYSASAGINPITSWDLGDKINLGNCSMNLATVYAAATKALINVWIANTSYSIGDICYSITGASYKRYECVIAGTSGTTEPSWTGIGTLVIDNTVTWIVDDIRDGTAPGDLCPPSMIVRSGRIKANGAAISRAAYPRLFNFANDNGLIVTETNWAAGYWGLFGEGDGSTTFRLPDLRGEFIRGYDDSRGVDSGRVLGSRQLDAFQGHRHTLGYENQNDGASGTAFRLGEVNNPDSNGFTTDNKVLNPCTDGTNGTPRTASETRPRNVAYYYTIKY